MPDDMKAAIFGGFCIFAAHHPAYGRLLFKEMVDLITNVLIS
ncbi:hypothetical protein DLM_0751 [Aquitalea magnusonii]|uniref:Uncharacterized protein n=1 Tax=Aquitalea magnusonii TaxID=332411 RepID=A0A3G9GC71_9NEIS|nr:hypothetical protein DLM_0751 [Aquitalea magnusonii]